MTSVVEASSTEEPVIIISRIFDAPRELLWKALTDPNHVAQWYGGHGFTNPVCEMDVRPGGLWRHVMQAPNGARFSINFVFLEVVEPERLVWTNAAEDERRGAGGPPKAVTTVTLEALGVRTRWTLVARFNSVAERDISAKMGFGHMISQGAERMAEHLKAL
jgi:uncharacterized protein YndB with AHSA1/START domain